MMGTWLNLESRKINLLPQGLISKFPALNKTKDFKKFIPDDTRSKGRISKKIIMKHLKKFNELY